MRDVLDKSKALLFFILACFIKLMAIASPAYANNAGLLIPISVGDMFVVIPRSVDATEYNAQVIDDANGRRLTWNADFGAQKYAIQVLNKNGVWENLLYTTENSIKLDARFINYTQVRVAACYSDSCSQVAQGSVIQNVFNTKFADVTSLIPANASYITPSAPYVDKVGSIKGSAGVSGGGATYNIPVELTPGRAGMQPNVSLNYSSRSGSGIAGKGWSLSAGAAITRCAATYAQDGQSQNPRYTQDDRLCLNGQKLIAISGTYGNSGAEYRTEIDSFAKITQHGGSISSTGSYFVVRQKNGHVSHYGYTANSRDIRSNSKGTYAWLIDHTRDASGKNYINYEYKEYGTNEKLLDRINYTSDSIANSGMHNVYFKYERAIDSTTKYMHGFSYQKTQRLKNIITQYYSTQTREYTMSYVQSKASGTELLSSIELCYGPSGRDCLPQTTFDWQDKAAIIKGTYVNINAGKTISSVLPNGDRNGDGAMDWPGFYINAEGQTTTNSHPVTQCEFSGTSGEKVNCHSDTADYDLDGITDDFNFQEGSSSTVKKLVVHKSSKFGWSTEIPTNIEVPQLSSFLHIGDMNGDSLPDIVIYEKSLNYYRDYINYYYHTGDFDTPYKTSHKQQLFEVSKQLNSTTPSESYALGGDFDGNGIPDFYKVSLKSTDMGQGKLSAIYLMSTNGKLLDYSRKSISWDDENDYLPTPVKAWSRFYRFADLNGDGLKDWFGWYNPKVNGSNIFVRYSKGDGSFTAPVNTGVKALSREFIFEESYGLQGNNEIRRSAYIPKYGDAIKVRDIDADGKEELLVPNGLLVRGCHNVSHVRYKGESVTEFCGDEIYTELIPSGPGVFKSIAGSYDRSLHSFAKVELENGQYISTDTDFIGSIYQSAMVDAQGDGLPDLVFNYGCESGTSGSNCRFLDAAPSGFKEGKVNISRNYGTGTGASGSQYRPLDILDSVTNGFGLKSEWEYRPLSSSLATNIQGIDNFYEANNNSERKIGYQRFSSSMYVVKEFKEDNGIGGDFVRRYAYRGAMYNTQGRGFSGFRSVIEADVTRGLTTQSDFHQHFPYTGKVKNKIVIESDKYVLQGRGLNSTENANRHTVIEWADNSSHNISGVYSVYAKSTYEAHLQVLSFRYNVISKTWTNNLAIDAFGNVTKTEKTHKDDYGSTTVTTQKTFENSTSNWWINKLVKQVVTRSAVSERHENDALTLYTGNEGALDSQTTITSVFGDFHSSRKARNVKLSGSSGKGNETVYEFNSYGLPTKLTKTAQVFNNGVWTSQSRSASTSYTLDGASVADSGYYVYETKNAKGHITRVNTDPKTGLKLSVHQQVNATDYLTTEYGYDRYLRPYSKKAEGTPTIYTAMQNAGSDAPRDAVLQVATISAGAPEQVTFMDKLGRTIRTKIENQGGSWIFKDSTFNDKGYPLFESQPYIKGQDSYGVRYGEYDALGRLLSKTTDQQCTPFSTGTMTAEYKHNRLKTTINVSESCYGIQLGEMTRTYNSRKQLMETKDALGGYTRYAYNSLGLPIVIRDAKGLSIIAKYDSFGNKVRVNDPNQGVADFIYNGFREPQKELRNGVTTINSNIDELGRVTSRSATGEETLTYIFDTLSYGQLTSAIGNGVTHSYSYDGLGRPVDHTISGDNRSFTTTTFYDANYGRVKGMRYPNNLTLEYIYDDKGYQTELKNKASGYVFSNATARDVFGYVQSQTLGNGLKIDNYYSRQSGQMTEHYTLKNDTNLLSIQYTSYDGFGNLKGLAVTSGELGSQNQFTESYDYDHLHRLKANQIAGHTTVSYDYDAVGNIISKSDYASQYNYTDHLSGHSGGGANAVKKVYKNGQWVGFSYDSRGNMVKGDGLNSASYNAMDKPTQITKNGITAQFTYGADHMRFKQVQGSITTYYAGKHYELEIEGNDVTTRAYIGDIALISTKSGSTPHIRYLHKDRLGSARLFTDASGNVVAKRNYDAFGKPRARSGGLKFTAQNGDLESTKTKRGFTEHEHLDELELIHMNGRVYDYNLGRFMSVDPVIQSPGNSQSINPYSYIMNNPLGGTDPTGYSSACQSKGADVSGDAAPGCGGAMNYDVGDGDKLIAMSDGNLYLDKGGDSLIKVDSIKRSGASGVVQNIDLVNGTVTFDFGSQESIAASSGTNQSVNAKLHESGEVNSYQHSNDAEFNKSLKDLNEKASGLELFDESDDAAKWLHDNAHPLSEKYGAEVGAEIYEYSVNGGKKYSIGNIVTSYHSGKVDLSNSNKLNDTGKPSLYGAWHSHGKSRYLINQFSASDIRTARNNGYSATYRSAHSSYDYYMYRQNNLLKLNMQGLKSNSNNHNDLLGSITCLKGDC
ncbi:hypothetical protein N480_13650 [Pseudoalteromonas luteoviolacea S2607]|uniref:SpvB/TcaC N-terminal domain-containing protein n=1 Tax=Pseudoalteromonas luteoviolacea TaxID=43657 RepID=UPI0007B088B0|nr:SpvB/TcaC N-terminal domain-containing protein [Pseudoalteromonas luteoviolacea]KZN38694.1 hypothetical protein N480_13650 [Pseudoalteromonas luteoviolacea S2607]